MGGYIRFDKDLADDARVLRLAEACFEHLRQATPEQLRDAADHMAAGVLTRLWSYADVHLASRDILKISVTHLCKLLRVSRQVLQSLPQEWLVIVDENHVRLPGYSRKNSLQDRDKRRLLNAERQRRFRDKRKPTRNDEVTRDVTRDKRDKSVTTGPRPVPVPDHRPDRTVNGSTAPPLEGAARSPSTENLDPALPRRRRLPKPTRSFETKPPEQLAADARKLSAAGYPPEDVAKMLGAHGVTPAQVTQWLAANP